MPRTDISDLVGFVPVVTTLPSSPYDGQEIDLLVDSGGSYGGPHLWRCKYRSATAGSYKWHVLGGAPLYHAVDTAQTCTTVYAALATAGPSITVPFAGDYIVTLGATLTMDSANSAGVMSFDIGATGAVDNDALWIISGGVRTDGSPGPDWNKRTIIEKPGLAASTALVSKYKRIVASAATFSYRRMWLQPKRIG